MHGKDNQNGNGEGSAAQIITEAERKADFIQRGMFRNCCRTYGDEGAIAGAALYDLAHTLALLTSPSAKQRAAGKERVKKLVELGKGE